jgi:NAD(P)-dependent dehydrogenase (short-subunit alcohol dehydrogenase family)
MSIEGRRVVVIGGSSGIGLATARAAAARGARVLIASRDPAKLEAARASLGRGVEALVLDVTDPLAVSSFFERAGAVDHLVSTTVARASGPLPELDFDAARHAFETKLWGPMHVIRTALPLLGWDGSITLTAGTAAWSPMPGGSATAAVNGAVAALVRTLAVELAPVRVNAVSPGIVRTPTWDAVPQEQRTAMFERIASKLPVGRVGEPDDIAAAYLYLMENEFSTGTVLHVEGGHLLVAPTR